MVPRRRTFWTEALARQLVARWQASGLSRADFCRREDVALSSFDLWRRKIEDDAGSSSAAVGRIDLVEVVMGDVAKSAAPLEAYEISFGDEVIIRMPFAAGAAAVVELVSSLRRSRAC
jgi:hypothetical protein